MAGELNITLTVAANKGSAMSNVSRSVIALLQDIAGTNYVQMTQTVTTTPTAVDLSSISTSAGYVFVRNTAPTGGNILLRAGSGGTDTILVRPGGVGFFQLNSTAGVPFATSSSGTVTGEFLIFEL